MNENFQAAINPNLFDYNFSLKSWITRSQCKLTTVKLSLTCYQNLKSSFTYDYIFCPFFSHLKFNMRAGKREKLQAYEIKTLRFTFWI